MELGVSETVSESGPLLSVQGIAAAAGRYRSLEFEFAAGVISMQCDDDLDEIIVGVGRADSGARPVRDAWAEPLLGKSIEYAWELRNHRGYNDAFQVRLVDDRDRSQEAMRQFEVAGSTIEVRSVVPTA